MALKKKRSHKLVDHVYEHLRSQLAARQVPMGAHLNSQAIARELEVSRSTIRQALPRLVDSGWVRLDEQGRPIVCGYPRSRPGGPQDAFEWANRAERTYERIFEMLLMGECRPGEDLSSHLLARRLGVSLATVRQALEWLCHKGLLVRLPRRGWKVGLLTQSDLDDAFHIRVIVEPQVARRAIGTIAPETLDELDEECKRMICGGESIREYERRVSDYRFHRALLEGANSPVFVDALDQILHKVMLASCLAAPRYRLSPSAFEEHREILRAIRDGNPQAAACEMAAHLVEARKRLLSGDTPLAPDHGTLPSDQRRP